MSPKPSYLVSRRSSEVAPQEIEKAVRAYAACADAYQELGLGVDAAEARLEGVLVAARSERPDPDLLRLLVVQAEGELAGSQAHKSLLSLARASVAWAAHDEAVARREITQALASAREAGQRDFVWRTLETRSEIAEVSGQPVSARRDREEALAVLEEIAARLPRDLREVFWNDPRRRRLRGMVADTLGSAATHATRRRAAQALRVRVGHVVDRRHDLDAARAASRAHPRSERGSAR